jgi:hypothetical protein
MSRRSSITVLVIWTVLLSSMTVPRVPADTPAPVADEPPPDGEAQAVLAAPPPVRPPVIEAAVMPPQPAGGKGRLAIDVSGTRRWCTFPDDRMVKPVEGPKSQQQQQQQQQKGNRNPIYTFGYQFTIAAVERSHPQETILLFESPVFRTAVLRQAAKLGHTGKAPPKAPTIGTVPDKIAVQQESPLAIVPLWMEEYRCVTLPEGLAFDLDPGTYDIYMAFDILLRSGGWTHRSVAFATDVGVAEGGATRLDATVSVVAGGRRDVELKSAASGAPAAGAAGR